jgi:hypothetical protein
MLGEYLEPTPEMGPFKIEVRPRSFKLDGSGLSQAYVYPDIFAVVSFRQGAVEFLLKDIPALRASLDEVERVAKRMFIENEVSSSGDV